MLRGTIFKARSFAMIETQGSGEMCTRPYESSGNGAAISKLQAILEQQSANNFKLLPGDISSFAGQLLRPSATAESVIDIPNGWGNKRLRFVLEIEAINDQGRSWYVITGYTSHSELSHSRQVDPEMDLFFNNIIKMRPKVEYTDDGRRFEKRVLAGCYQILTVRDSYGDYTGGRDNRTFGRPIPKLSMTPTNILGRIELDFDQGRGSRATVDTRTFVGSGTGISMTSRRNNISSHYLAGTANAITHGARQAAWDYKGRDIGGSGLALDRGVAFARARETAKRDEPNVVEDDFVQALSTTRYSDLGYISYQEMISIFGKELDDCCRVVVGGAMEIAHQLPSELRFNAQDTQHWESRLKETELASYLIQAIPSMMSECLLMRIVFNATNNTLRGEDVLEIIDGTMLLSDVDSSDFFAMFYENFLNQIAPDISHGGILQYDISMECEIMGETRITIRLDGHPYNYYAPSYCDNLYAPTLTTSEDRFSNLSNDIVRISGLGDF